MGLDAKDDELVGLLACFGVRGLNSNFAIKMVIVKPLGCKYEDESYTGPVFFLTQALRDVIFAGVNPHSLLEPYKFETGIPSMVL